MTYDYELRNCSVCEHFKNQVLLPNGYSYYRCDYHGSNIVANDVTHLGERCKDFQENKEMIDTFNALMFLTNMYKCTNQVYRSDQDE